MKKKVHSFLRKITLVTDRSKSNLRRIYRICTKYEICKFRKLPLIGYKVTEKVHCSLRKVPLIIRSQPNVHTLYEIRVECHT
jgi:hypothetical protein